MKNNNKTRKYILAEKACGLHPEQPSRSLARMLFAQYPALYKDIEDARSAVRYYRNAVGEVRRERRKGQPQYKQTYLIAEESVDKQPFIIQNCSKLGIIADLHIPNHRNKPIEIALNKFEEIGIDTLLINGDLMDNTPYTKHAGHPPTYNDAKKWMEKTEFFLEGLRMRFPKAQIIWAEGNHDNWWIQYVQSKAPALLGDEYFTLPERLHLHEYNIQFVDQSRYLMAGKLAIVHGHHLVKGVFAPVNAARGIFLRAKVSCMISHVHNSSEHSEADLHKNLVTCWSTGCLCTLTPDYAPMGGKSNHGFATVHVDKSGDYKVNNYRIYNNKLM
jgi:predicted phosphodiesterase